MESFIKWCYGLKKKTIEKFWITWYDSLIPYILFVPPLPSLPSTIGQDKPGWLLNY